MDIGEQLLTEALAETFRRATSTVSKMEDVTQSGEHYDSESGEMSFEYAGLSELLAADVEKAFRDVANHLSSRASRRALNQHVGFPP
jgi:hypothetical protein